MEVHPGEPFGANALCCGGTVFVQSAHPRTAARIEAAGVPVRALDIGEFAKAEAGLTCMSVILPVALAG